MKWKNQINILSKKIRRMIYIFRDLQNILDSTKLRHIYLALVQSIITYGIVGWGGSFNNVLTELQVCQNQILKVAFNKSLRYHSKTLYKDLKILNIKKLYYKTIAIFLRKNNMLNCITQMALIPDMLITIFQ
jgi:hypothetical protein